MQFTKDYPLLSSVGAQGISSLLTPKPSGVSGPKYKSYTGNFQASTPSTAFYNPIYKPTAYAVGGPVEQMAAQNAVGGNTMYPQAGLQTPMYSNPQLSRPMASNVVSPTGDVAVDPYTGEQKFADGGVTDNTDAADAADAQQAANNRRLMGIKTAQDTAATMEDLKSYNAKGMTAGKGYSKIQQTYSPFTAANKEYTAMAKKYGIPVAPMPKTSIDLSGSTEDTDFADGGIAQEAANTRYNLMTRSSYNQPQYRPQSPNIPFNRFDAMRGMNGPAYNQQQPQNAQFDNDHNNNMPNQYGNMGMGGAPNQMGQAANIQGQMGSMMGHANGGIMHGLGGYSDGGHLLKGPGDGVSDSIPAVIGDKQPARLADGEFVVPARIVSELGNGSTEAGARQLYAMMERIQKGRKKSIGKDKVAVNSKASKYLPK
jgi:hypothetical protein